MKGGVNVQSIIYDYWRHNFGDHIRTARMSVGVCNGNKILIHWHTPNPALPQSYMFHFHAMLSIDGRSLPPISDTCMLQQIILLWGEV